MVFIAIFMGSRNSNYSVFVVTKETFEYNGTKKHVYNETKNTRLITFRNNIITTKFQANVEQVDLFSPANQTNCTTGKWHKTLP